MEIVMKVIQVLVVVVTLQVTVAYLIYMERKVSAYMQGRIGPNRVGWRGLLQPIADGVKLFLKEDLIPAGANKGIFLLAPAIAVFTTTLAFAVVPFGPTSPGDAGSFVIAPQMDVAILFVFAVGSLAVYAVILGGWSSNNKYSFLGAIRSTSQMISYEIPLGLSVLGVVILARSLNLEMIVAAQADRVWFVCYQPVACLLFFTSALAESNRLPFDLPECEQELRCDEMGHVLFCRIHPHDHGQPAHGDPVFWWLGPPLDGRGRNRRTFDGRCQDRRPAE